MVSYKKKGGGEASSRTLLLNWNWASQHSKLEALKGNRRRKKSQKERMLWSLTTSNVFVTFPWVILNISRRREISERWIYILQMLSVYTPHFGLAAKIKVVGSKGSNTKGWIGYIVEHDGGTDIWGNTLIHRPGFEAPLNFATPEGIKNPVSKNSY